jgi:hypothetical protein
MADNAETSDALYRVKVTAEWTVLVRANGPSMACGVAMETAEGPEPWSVRPDAFFAVPTEIDGDGFGVREGDTS